VILTVPYKERGNVVYVDGAVYERNDERSFFAREYDETTFSQLVAESPFSPADTLFITERNGLWAVDYYEWGPGKDRALRSALLRRRVALQLLTGRSVDGPLARRYLAVEREPQHRLVNIAARLKRATSA
jgi:hypothetical protein